MTDIIKTSLCVASVMCDVCASMKRQDMFTS